MSQNDNTRQAVILGALLHDVGKFVQRAQDNPKRQDHQHWGLAWLQQKDSLREKPRLAALFSGEELATIDSAILSHHEAIEYISLADAISAGMERIPLDNEEKGDPFTDRLISTISRISISNIPKKDKYHKLALLGEINLEEAFPESDRKNLPDDYVSLLDKFNKEVKSLNFTRSSPLQVIEQIYFLLWKYTWCIPSAAYEDEPDVSLFDHLKTTATIAGCLYDYKNERREVNIDSPAFQIIGGDISGIQSYIFDVLQQHGKVAKRLRARSLFVQLLSEIASHKILHAFKLPLCNLIISAGGNFYILAPNIKDARNRLDRLQNEFDNWTLKELRGEVSIHLASLEVSGKELGNFSMVLDKLKTKLSRKKYQPHKSILLSENKWTIEKFIQGEVIEGDEKACKGCHKNPIVKDELCKQCLKDIEVGQFLPRTKYIAFFRDNKKRSNILDYSFELWDIYRGDKDAYLVLALNDTKQTGIGFKYLAKHIPTINEIHCTTLEHQHESNEPVSFECIANNSCGDKLLGYLKADVDNLGAILKKGFNNPSISRMTTFSRMLEFFFAGYLQTMLEKDYQDLYTLFSGGDDFFIVGPWNRVVYFAKEIRTQFSQFCGGNPDLTFSAGIILARDHEPISFCADSVETELKKSKSGGKNSITLFNQTVSWDELKGILEKSKWIVDKLEKEPPDIPRGIIYNFRQYGEMALNSGICEKGRDIKTQYLKFVPMLTYDINRNLTKESQHDMFEWAESLKPSRDLVVGKDLPYLKTIMEYVLTYTRGE